MAALAFLQERTSDKRLQARATSLRTGGFLSEHLYERGNIDFLLDSTSSDIVRVLAVQQPRFFIPSRGRSEEALDMAAKFSVNYARWRWTSNQVRAGPRFAMRVRNYLDGTGERLMVNRSSKRCDDAVGDKRGPDDRSMLAMRYRKSKQE
ncbi:hypothetical protein GQ600_17632 [Phytophthora cactorum]|nr:hypothetical protein GQ600_17632 [Phytophthora cactorum]